MREEIRRLAAAMEERRYVADRGVATAVHLARRLGKPLLVEGEAGVGKTELAKVLAAVLGTELIRLQCYEGLDVHTALYEWNYPKQLLRIRLESLRGAPGGGPTAGAATQREGAATGLDGVAAAPAGRASRVAGEPPRGEGDPLGALEHAIFGREYLLERPLLRAITRDRPPVLLIDEVDRADEEFEAFLLELLSEFQVSIPELGTIRATSRPHVVITSNGTRELSDALRRRCLYLWIDHPSFETELRILHARLPAVPEGLDRAIVRLVQRLREEQLSKLPGVAETLDWSEALLALEVPRLDEEVLLSTLGCLVKDRHDFERLGREGPGSLLDARGAVPEGGPRGRGSGGAAASGEARGPA